MNLKRFSGSALVTASGLLLFTQSSCSVVVNDFQVQCDTTKDCVDLADRQPVDADGKLKVTGLVCNTDKHVCERESGCHTNVECQDAHNGEPYICRASDRTCQSLILPSLEPGGANICEVLADPGDFKNENTIWLGASVIFAPGTWQGLEMVRQDFNGLAMGLPPASATSKERRPLAFVYCEADPTLEEGVGHLVNDLELPAIITSLDTTSEITALTKYSLAKANKVFQLSTSAGGPLLKTVDNQGMLLDLVLINENYDIETTALVKSHYVPLLQASGGPLKAGELPRVAVLHSGTPTYENTSRKIIAALNDAKVASDIKDIGYGSQDEPSGNPGSYKSAAAEVLKFAPHVIIVLGDDEIGPYVKMDDAGKVTESSDGIDVPIETKWAMEHPDQPRPQWLGILGSVGQLPKDMRSLADPAAQVSWGSRSLFIQQHYDFKGKQFTSYINQLTPIVLDADPTDDAGVIDLEGTSPYNEFMREGAYLTAYSIALLTAQGKPITGTNLAAAARSFGSKNSGAFTVGPDDIFPALQAIAGNKKPFDLQNFQGWNGFDEHGFATYTFADDVACVTPALDKLMMPTVGDLQPTGGIFEVTGSLTGTISLNGCVTK